MFLRNVGNHLHVHKASRPRRPTSTSSLKLEVCTGPDLGLTRPEGPSLVAQIMFGSGPGSGLVQMTAIKRYIEHFGLYLTILFSQRKFTRSCDHLMLVKQSHRFDFLRDFHSCPRPEIVRENTLQTWHAISLYRSSNAKITSYILTASLNKSFYTFYTELRHCSAISANLDIQNQHTLYYPSVRVFLAFVS
jgi:hypothetical protein